MAQAQAKSPGHAVGGHTRWLQLLLGFIVMMTISSPQYVWTLFVPSFQKTTGSILSQVQWTITILIVLQTWLSPLQGYLVDRLGPKALIGLGALMSGAGWIASAYIADLWGLYATYGLLCGVGTGIVYIGIIGLMVRWFPERRGFATGIVAAGVRFWGHCDDLPHRCHAQGLGLSFHAHCVWQRLRGDWHLRRAHAHSAARRPSSGSVAAQRHGRDA